MDWDFIKEEILELLDSNGLNESNVDNIDQMIAKFVIRLSNKFQEENEYAENGTHPEWDSIQG
tara:strand:+ start:1913 stop:2101 length:189 start_codon:yes stop_codon:yes gene_type:complete